MLETLDRIRVPRPHTLRLGNLYWRKKLEGWHGTAVRYMD